MSYPPQGFHAIDDIQVVAQMVEPAVPASKLRVWHDNTPAAERRWLILGTDGTVGGNQKVEIS